MKIKKTDREILALALPAIFSNITVPLLGLSDTYISGHLGSDRYVAAIAVGSMMMNSCFWLFGFLRAGTTGLTAEALGREDSDAGRKIFTLAFSIAAAIGIALILLSYPLRMLMLWLMDPPAATAILAGNYFMLCIFGAPALLTTMTITGWMIGMQNTLYPMIVSISVNVLNIVISFSLVFLFNTGFYGVAVGTLSANWAGLLIALRLARRLARHSVKDTASEEQSGRIWCSLRNISNGIDIGRFFRVNSDLMLRSACILCVTFGMTAFGGRMGDLTLAVNAIIMQLFLFYSYFSDGFAFSAEALCGRLAGARDRHKFQEVIRRLWGWIGGVSVLFAVIYFLGVGKIAEFLADSPAIEEGAIRLKYVIGLVPLISGIAFLYDGIYIGLTATRSMLVITLAGSLFFLSSYYLCRALGYTSPEVLNSALWTGFLGFLAIRAFGLVGVLPHELKRLKLINDR